MVYYTLRIVLVVVFTLIAAILHQGTINNKVTPLSAMAPRGTTSRNIVIIARVIDGDTIKLSTGEKVRYIGIDTPEHGECFFVEASEKNKELVLGKSVRLESDVSNTDRYGRLLRYVYAPQTSNRWSSDDHLFVNEVLVREGYAVARSYPPDITKQDILRKAERYARKNKKGLWADGACN